MKRNNPFPGELLKVVKDNNVGRAIGRARNLLERSAGPNERDPGTNKTPLMYAAVRSPMLTEILIEHGAELDAQDSNGMTALMYAAHDDPKIMRLLIEKGASVDIKDNWGNTAIDWASKGRNPQAIAILQPALEQQQQLAAEKADDAEQEKVAEFHATALTRQDVLKKCNRRPQMGPA